MIEGVSGTGAVLAPVVAGALLAVPDTPHPAIEAILRRQKRSQGVQGFFMCPPWKPLKRNTRGNKTVLKPRDRLLENLRPICRLDGLSIPRMGQSDPTFVLLRPFQLIESGGNWLERHEGALTHRRQVGNEGYDGRNLISGQCLSRNIASSGAGLVAHVVDHQNCYVKGRVPSQVRATDISQASAAKAALSLRQLRMA